MLADTHPPSPTHVTTTGSVFLWFDESVGWQVGAVVVWAVVSVVGLV
ncbi:hypothetical protein Tsubulata_031346, partial [Turnera subulata]